MPNSVVDYEAQIKLVECRLHTYVRDIRGLTAISVAAIKTNDQDFALESRLEFCEAQFENFNRVWDELFAVKTAAGQEFPTDQWIDIRDEIRDALLHGQAVLKRIQRQQQNERPLPAPGVLADINATLPVPSLAKAHLPKIPIPQFHGDITKWSHFKDTYESLVHREDSLSNVEKFHYLLGALKGEAHSLVSNLPIEDGSYAQAWSKLNETYGNTRVLGSLLVQRIVDSNPHSAKSETQRHEAFLTGVADNIQAFLALDLPDHTEFLLSCLALRALDPSTRRQFEITLKPDSPPPTSEDVINFVRQRKIALKMSEQITSPFSGSTQHKYSAQASSRTKFPNRDAPRYNPVALHAVTPTSSPRTPVKPHSTKPTPGTRCLQCKGSHNLAQCPQYWNMDVQQRRNAVKGWRVCFNCLNAHHLLRDCPSRTNCRKCNQRHHTTLHVEVTPCPSTSGRKTPPQSKSAANTIDGQDPVFTGFGSSHPSAFPQLSQVLLGTVKIVVVGNRGKPQSIRAVLDSGSERSFITESIVKRIGSKVFPVLHAVQGIGHSPLNPSLFKGITSCVIRTRNGSSHFPVTPLVTRSINRSLPSVSLNPHVISQFRDFPLADASFGESSPVDMLLGADMYFKIINGFPVPSPVDGLFLTSSAFGMVVAGEVSGSPSRGSVSLFAQAELPLESQLKSFWELEEPCAVDRAHPDDVKCEQHFLQTHTRTTQGRYMVRLPLRTDVEGVGCNRTQVHKRFLNLEQKLTRDQELREKYHSFMREYLELGHMSVALKPSPYLIPHHGVWQDTPGGPKLRVVFDASCSSYEGNPLSLNDTLLSGPKLQKDISEILIRFRMYRVPLCGDIVKMYRQILVHPDDRQLQHILWRGNPSEPLEEYELNTVTYGVKPSAFQAIRVLQQLVHDEGHHFPLAADRVEHDMYVDDIVTGASSTEEAVQLQQQLIDLFARGGFTLGKWASTVPQLLPSMPELPRSVQLSSSENHCVKILGLVWNSGNDTFSYAITQPPLDHISKRRMLSCVARCFDPLGLLAPVIFTAKLLIQEVWKLNLGWDDQLPAHMLHAWVDLMRDWQLLSTVAIPRYTSLPGAVFHLVGFCDASSKGYAAAVYLRAEDQGGHTEIFLIKAKTKVAPVKPLTIARLELCGALLLSRIIRSMPAILPSDVICYTDSEVALAWLNSPVHSLRTFEANRVAQILDVIPATSWRHVRSADNPADIASRGCNPPTLLKCDLWWNGPNWLLQPISQWFQPLPNTVVLTTISPHTLDDPQDDWSKRFSSYRRLVRVIALILRWKPSSRSRCYRLSDPISAQEYADAESRVCRFVQRISFPKELYTHKETSYLSALAPFLDESGVLRVGGRLEQSSLASTTKHPIIIPPKSHVARLLVESVHRDNFHAGPSLTLALLRSKFWIPRAPKLIRSVILRCVQCRIQRAKPISAYMAPLPAERVRECRPFDQTGVDYAGPFTIRESRRRNAKTYKAYLCLFVCMSTKALHLELTTALSTSAFLDALERFMARRGTPSTMWSDHGTNFVGASRFLKDIYRFQRDAQPDLTNALSSRGVEWKFIPPRAPHFGGLWEAGVKSVKRLLTGAFGCHPVTFEELTTALAKVEALLNSRPLCPLTTGTDNFDFLTPGHFLNVAPGDILPSPPDPPSVTARWAAMQQRIAHLWDRWRREYLHSLQQRSKWTRRVPAINVGDLVVLLEKRNSVGTWPVARVTQTFPGRDGHTRVVEVKIPSGSTFTRAISSVVPLLSPEIPENISGDLQVQSPQKAPNDVLSAS